MIVLSPELIFMFKFLDKWRGVIELNFRYLKASHRRFFWRRLISNLMSLKALGILNVLYVSSSVVQIEVLDEEFFRIIKDIARSVNYDIYFEIHDRDLCVLEFFHRSPFSKEIHALSAALGVTTRCVKKIISKLCEVNLMDRNSKVTSIGLGLLRLLNERGDLFFSKFKINPFLSLRIIGSIDERIIESVSSLLGRIIEYNVQVHGKHISSLSLIAFECDRRIYRLVRGILKKVNIRTVSIPITLSRDALYRIMLDLGRSYGSSLIHSPNNILEKAKKIKEVSMLFNIISEVTSTLQYDVVLLLTPPAVAYVVDRYSHLMNGMHGQIIMLPRLDREIMFLANNIEDMHRKSKIIVSSFMSAIREHRNICIEWNKDSKYPSYLEIKFCHNAHQSLKSSIFRVEDGVFYGPPFYIPLGEVRINLVELARAGAEIKGIINLLGEPIIGLKTPSKRWMEYLYGDLEATLHVGNPRKFSPPHIVEISNKKGPWANILQNSYIAELHIGLNQTSRERTYEPISPIITRTDVVIHFWIVNPQQETFYQLIVKNAEIYMENKVLWRTKK